MLSIRAWPVVFQTRVGIADTIENAGLANGCLNQDFQD